MPKFNTVEQTENDLFEPEIQLNSPKKLQFWPQIGKTNRKYSGISQLMNSTTLIKGSLLCLYLVQIVTFNRILLCAFNFQ